MDIVQIGRFISQLRKEQNLTQEQLGEILGVTNKTVSRWETGSYLPPVESLQGMSALFSVSINEILAGKRLQEAESKTAAEENLTKAISPSSFLLKERIDYFKKKWLKDHLGILVFLGIIISVFLAVGILWKKPLLCASDFLLLLAAHAWRNNAMMTYVEQKAFDGSGSDEE